MNSWPVKYDPKIGIIPHKKDKITIGSFVLVTIIGENAEVCQYSSWDLGICTIFAQTCNFTKRWQAVQSLL